MTTRMMVPGALLLVLAGTAAAESVPGSYCYSVDHVTRVDKDAKVLVWAPLPPVWHGQEVELGDIVPEPVAILEDPVTGNRVVEWLIELDHDKPVPPYMFFRYDYDFVEKPIRMEIDAATVQPYDQGSEIFQRYTAAETWFQTKGPVLDRARAIVGAETNPWRRVELIYDWIVENLRYEVPGPEGRHAESVLEAGRGDCEQFSVLMTAMCRALGIPARTVTSAWTQGGDHVFLEVWIEGYGWVPADPSLGQLLGPLGKELRGENLAGIMAGRNVPMGDPRWLLGNLFDARMVVIVGNNITVDSPTLGRRITFQSLRSGGRNAQPPASRVEGLNRDVVQGGFYVFGEKLADDEAAHVATHQRLSRLFFNVGMVDAVEDVCRKSIRDYGEGVLPWINLGKVYLHKGEYYKAEAAFKRALTGEGAGRDEMLEGMVWAHNYLGNCYDLLDHRDMALVEYRTVIDLDINFRGAVDYAKRFLDKPFTKEKIERM